MTGIPKDMIDDIKCPKCSGEIFELYYKLGKVSALKSPTGKEIFTQLPLYKCIQCNEFVQPNLLNG